MVDTFIKFKPILTQLPIGLVNLVLRVLPNLLNQPIINLLLALEGLDIDLRDNN